jgi:glycosyltransferase involved in cell wall biosynthesis
VITGGGDRLEGLTRLAGELGLTDRVVLTGPRHDVPALLAAIDVFVLCSYTECFPMALLEAMASSRPAVCTAVGGVPEMIEEGVSGYLVPARDPHALAARISALVASPDLRRAFGTAARARVESEFSLRVSVLATEQHLLEVAAMPLPKSGPVRLALVLDETFLGGVEMLMLNLFQSFDPAVVAPRLICLRTPPGPLAADFRDAGFEVEVLQRRGRWDVRTLPDLVRSLRRDRTDVVLVTHHHRASLALGRLAARMTGARSVVAVHGMDLTAIGKRCLPRWTVATLREAGALVLLSPLQADYLHREEGVGRHWWSRTREVVIPNGIPLLPVRVAVDKARARLELGLGNEDFVVGIVARLSAEKAHQVLFAAFAALLRSHPRAQLVVVGGGERESELRQLAARLAIEDHVLFTGARRDVQELMPAFDVSCLSSVHEGVPIAAIESMAAGVPMVVTDCGALRDVVRDGEHGFIVPVADHEALADRLAKLADNPDLRDRMGRSARAEVEQKYRVELTARGYESLLAGLVGDR